MAVIQVKYECTCAAVISFEGDAAYTERAYFDIIKQHLLLCPGPPVAAPVINYPFPTAPPFPSPPPWEVWCSTGTTRSPDNEDSRS
jgi:hypothetical protein